MSENSTMRDKLSNLRPKLKSRYVDDIREPSPSPMNWKADGEDHINIWEHSSTELGKLLAHNSDLPFKHCVFGHFCSMESFWYYLQSEQRDDRVRTMSGLVLKNFSKRLTMTRVENFRAIIMHSNYQRIKQYKPLVEAVRESTLPFDCYFVNSDSGIRVRPNFFKWLIKGFEEIRSALKENREPDFNFLLDKRNSTIYEFVAPSYKEKTSEEKPKSVKQKQGSLLTAVREEVKKQNQTEESVEQTVADTVEQVQSVSEVQETVQVENAVEQISTQPQAA